MGKVRYVRNIEALKQIPATERNQLAKVADKYAFRANEYYLDLIDWDNPEDSIRRIIVPQIHELDSFGELDASGEMTNYVAPGCQHKYADTALLLCTEVCGAYCRFCFRKRLFMDGNDETTVDLSAALDYIRRNQQITNVLMTGGDPLFLSTQRLEAIISELRGIEHVGIIRIGTKMPAFNPYRIIDDPQLTAMLARYSTRRKRIYLVTHFNVPQEISETAILGLDLLAKAGVILANQTPMLKGINIEPEILAELMQKTADIGLPSYYFFQCRPTEGNLPFEPTLVESYNALEEAKSQVSGLAKRARLVMSHETGKVEMVGLTDDHIYLKYLRARLPEDEGRFMMFRRNDEAYWLDDLTPADASSELRQTYGQPHIQSLKLG